MNPTPPQGGVGPGRHCPLPTEIDAFAFDLDDTLHHYSRAADQAAERAFQHLIRRGYEATRFQDAYHLVLVRQQASSFTDGRPANAYTAERFRHVMHSHGWDDEAALGQVTEVYNQAIAENLKLIEGADKALSAVRQAGYPVIVVSEGPHDGQELTLARLGIEAHIDLLVTSSREGISKADGLFRKACRAANCHPSRMLVVGDSLERDILPAQALGMPVFHFASHPSPQRDIPTLRSWAEFGTWLSSEPADGASFDGNLQPDGD